MVRSRQHEIGRRITRLKTYDSGMRTHRRIDDPNSDGAEGRREPSQEEHQLQAEFSRPVYAILVTLPRRFV